MIREPNKWLEDKIRSKEFASYVAEKTNDHPFFRRAVDRFTFTVVDFNEEINEPDYGCVFTIDRFENQIHTIEDIFVQFFHTSLHEWCEQLWLTCPLSKSNFSPMELDVYEEIFGQAMVNKHIPNLYDLFPNSIREYMKKNNIVIDRRIERVLRLFDVPSSDSCIGHVWLYEHLDKSDEILFLGFFALMTKIPDDLDLDIDYYYYKLGSYTNESI